jgi:hypothetical protein
MMTMGKQHLNRANLTKILDGLIYRPSIKKAMGSIGASPQLMFQWATKSRNAERDSDRQSEFYIEWPVESGIFDFFHGHVARARVASLALYEAEVRDDCLGREVPVLGPDQRPVYQLRPEYIGRDDFFVEISEGCTPGDVPYYRLLRDDKGHPVPLTRIEMPPATVRVKVLEQLPNYIHREQHDVNVQGHVTVAPPLRRLPGEAPVDLPRLRELAALSPEERRRVLNASPVPRDANGLRTIPALPAPINRDQPDDQGHGLRPAAEFVRPPQPKPTPPEPSYARRPVSEALDTGEQTGRGTVPPGGFRVDR